MGSVQLLPSDPVDRYVKPTYENTNGGKKYKPTHPGLFAIEFDAGNKDKSSDSYASRLVAVKDIPPNVVVCKLENLSLAPEKAYSSVQFGPGPRDHFELNSDLLFMNHSCSPSIYLDLSSDSPSSWCLRTTPRGIKAGEPVTFFYPSTEWDMAQGFQCTCGAEDCLGEIKGAKCLSIEELEKRAPVNDHIRRLIEESGMTKRPRSVEAG